MRKVFFLILLLSNVFCYAGNYMFKHIEVKDGLSSNHINNIFKDKSGYMWFSTASGLNRYDGLNVKVFRNSASDIVPLVDNYVKSVQEDINGNLWIETQGGYNIYDPLIEAFVSSPKEFMFNYGINTNPKLIHISNDKDMWMYSENKEINLLKPLTKLIYTTTLGAKDLPNGDVKCMIDAGEEMVMVLGNGTLVALNRIDANLRWKEDFIAKNEGKRKNVDFSLFVDKKKNIWVYGPLGLWIYDVEKKRWNNNIKNLVKSSEPNDFVNAIAEDGEGNIWIGYDKSGITIFNPLNSQLTYLRNNPADTRSIGNNNIISFYNDDKGTMWVGTYKGGVSFYNQSGLKFGLNNIGDVTSIEEDANGSLWIGTNDTGLINWNRKEDKITTYIVDKANSISSNSVLCLLKDNKSGLWIGTARGGLNYLENGKFTSFLNDSTNANSLANNNVSALAYDANGNIWIGTLGGGIQSFNPIEKRFKTYNVESRHLLSDIVSSIFISGDEMIVGTSRGISLINISDGKSVRLTGTKSGKADFSNNNVTQVFKDSRELIWIATQEGLNIYNPKIDDLTVLTERNGLSSNIISAITEDVNNNIWITTSKGVTNVSVLLDRNNGEYSYKLRAYDRNDGLQSSEFNQRSIKRLSNGDILIGGLYGVNYFNPQTLQHNKIAPRVIFTGLCLFNKEVKIGENVNGDILLPEALNNSRTVTLNYNQNIFTIDLSTDDNIDKIKYLYKLEGFNNEWLTAVNGKITFTNLSGGKYLLKVKAENNDHLVGPEAELEIIITPPFWLTIWAYIIYVLLFIGLIELIRRVIAGNARRKLNRHKKETTADKSRELDDMKTRFLVNIGHELRNPITKVISPLEVLIKENENDVKLSRKLNAIHHNAKKLMSVVNEMVDFRQSEFNAHNLSLSDGDIVAFIKNIIENTTAEAENKKLRIFFKSNVTSLNVLFDPDKVEKIFNNLLENSIKFTPEGGKIDVSMDLVYDDTFKERLNIKVADTGIGIKNADKEKIFDRFYQVYNPDIVSTGSGIGLSIVKDFVGLFKGTIKVEDNVPNGVVFIIDVPVNRNVVVAEPPVVEEDLSTDGVIRAVEDESSDTSYIHTIQEIRAAIASGKLDSGDGSNEGEDSNFNELGIETVSTIKMQKATVIMLTEEGNDIYHKTVISSEDIPDYDTVEKKKSDERVVSDFAKDLMLDKDGKPKKMIENKPTVIMVDDDVDFLQFMKDALSFEYNIILGKNGNEGLELVKENRPDLIIADLKMPQMDGKELCKIIKNNRATSQIPFILLTSDDAKYEEQEGATDGADEVIAKPFNIEILMITMKKLIENKYNKSQSYINLSTNDITITSMDEKLIEKAIKYIEENMSRSDLSVEELSKELGMSRVHLYKKLLSITGKTPIEFIRVIRLKRAAQFLRESQNNVSEIAFHVGFNNPKYFTKYFKEEFGVLPSVYQEQNAK